VAWLPTRKNARNWITLYFNEPDETGHTFGPVSTQTRKTVEKMDSVIGVLRSKLSALPDAKKINLIIVSDHGMAAVSPERYINVKSLVPDRMIASISGGNPVYLINPSEGKKDSVLYLLTNQMD